MTDTDFVDIIGYEGVYQINRLGQVKSIRETSNGRYYGNLKSPYTHPRGYCEHKLFKDGKYCSKLLHRLLAEAFIPNPENKPTVDHIDRNTLNNKISNLRWATHLEQHYNMSTTINKTPEESKKYNQEYKNEWRRRNRKYLAAAQELRDIEI